jgi:hypothetical protein
MKKGKPGQRMRWNVIADAVGTQPVIGVELGVLEGTCSSNLLRIMPQLQLYMIDRWSAYTQAEIDAAPKSRMPLRPQEYFDEAYNRAKAIATEYGDRAVIIKGESAKAANYKRSPDQVDFVFFDARHDREGLEADIAAWILKVRDGGWLFFHDYNSKNHPDVSAVVDAVFTDIHVDADHMAVVRV